MAIRTHAVLFGALALASWSCTGDDPDIGGGGTTPTVDGGPNGGGGDGAVSEQKKLAIAEPPALSVIHGTSVKVKVTVTRTAFTGDVIVQASALPTGVTIDPITIPDGSNEGEVTVATVTDAPQVASKVKLDATSSGGAEKASALLSLTVRGRAGEVDTTFNGGEVPTGAATPIGLATGPGGELYVLSSGGLGKCFVRRLSRDGQPDSSFATSGVATIELASLFCGGFVVQDDGKIVVGGLLTPAQGSGVVGRFLATGAPDPTFAPDGFVSVPGMNGVARVAIDANKNIVAFGRNGDDAHVRRLVAADGTPDSAYAATTIAGMSGADFALAADGSTRVVGTAGTVIELARVDANGNESLPSAQRVTLDSPLASTDQGRLVAVDPSGAAYVGGVARDASDRFVVARVHNDIHDTTWATKGWFDVQLVGSTTPGAILVEPAGGLLLIGTAGTPTSRVFLVRVKADGKVESAFADSGIEQSPTEATGVAGATVQGEQAVVLIAKANNSAALVRYWR